MFISLWKAFKSDGTFNFPDPYLAIYFNEVVSVNLSTSAGSWWHDRRLNANNCSYVVTNRIIGHPEILRTVHHLIHFNLAGTNVSEWNISFDWGSRMTQIFLTHISTRSSLPSPARGSHADQGTRHSPRLTRMPHALHFSGPSLHSGRIRDRQKANQLASNNII